MKRGGAVAAVLAFLLLPWWSRNLQPNDYRGGRSRDSGASAERNTSALAAMLGEFRTALSDLLYIKTERYLHSGVAYAPHLEPETLTTVGTIAEIDDHHADASTRERRVTERRDADEPVVKTLVPSPADDFRGFVGRLQREVKPWQDPSQPHLLTDGREMLPWFRVMTMSDPHYVRGYAVGGWWLQRRNLDAALRFVGEGMTNNPASFEVLYTMGELHMEEGRRANAGELLHPGPRALACFQSARDCFVRAAELAASQRPLHWHAGTNDASGWTVLKEEDALGSVRMAALTEQRYGDPVRAAQLARRYQAVFGANPVLERIAAGPPRNE